MHLQRQIERHLTLAEGEVKLLLVIIIEYSAMKFGLFQVGEYAAMSASNAICNFIFGGYQIPWIGYSNYSSKYKL